MKALTGFSRRQMLAMSASAGCLAIESTFHSASAQGAKKIEQYAPELEQVLSTAEPVQELASGTGGHSGRPKGRFGGRTAAICFTATFTIADA
jgi:hypothetical protein